ncbi:MAG: shikimate kinase [Thermodesulfobacteriota bacterium]
MKSNLTLIGMPGAGKSTIGIILAKFLACGFIDTDILIQINRQKSLQQIIDESDHLNLRKIEEEEILKINVAHHIIATGGSAVYSAKAMNHLKDISTIIFLDVGYEELTKRIHNFGSRGIARSKGQTFMDLYNERQALYNRYAELVIDCVGLDQEEIAEKISEIYHQQRMDE